MLGHLPPPRAALCISQISLKIEKVRTCDIAVDGDACSSHLPDSKA